MEIIKKIFLNHCNTYSSLIYNCFYTFINPNLANVSIYNDNLSFIMNKNTCDNYYSITKYNNYYIASKKEIKDKLYVLSDCFVEKEEIRLNVPKEYLGNIESIFYDNINKRILLANKYNVYSVTEDGYFIKKEIESIKNDLKYKNEYIKDRRGCLVLQQKRLENNLEYTTVGIFCNKKYIAINDNNIAYLLEVSNSGAVINKYYIGENIVIKSIVNKNNNLELLVNSDNKYSYIYVTSNKCLSNYPLCCKMECHKECNKECKCDIVESIALMEVSLAHILNSEGEKLQYVLKHNNMCDILKTNDSINRTINSTTMLEQVLYDKLKIVLEKCK